MATKPSGLRANLRVAAFFLALEIAWLLMAAALFVLLDAATTTLRGGLGG